MWNVHCSYGVHGSVATFAELASLLSKCKQLLIYTQSNFLLFTSISSYLPLTQAHCPDSNYRMHSKIGGRTAPKGGRTASKGGRTASKGGRTASKGERIASKPPSYDALAKTLVCVHIIGERTREPGGPAPLTVRV